MSTHIFKVQQKPYNNQYSENDFVVIDFLKKNINGWALTPIESNEFTQTLQKEVGDMSKDKQYVIDEELKLELTTRIEAFQKGLILLNPVFECDSCDVIGRWDDISHFDDYKTLTCNTCALKNEEMADDSKDNFVIEKPPVSSIQEFQDSFSAVAREKARYQTFPTGTGIAKLSCTFWKYEGDHDTVKDLHHATPVKIVSTEKDTIEMIPKNAKPVARQVVNLMSENDVKMYYCMQMHELGPRLMTVPQIIKRDPQLAFNALLHGKSSNIQSIFASLLAYYCTMLQNAQAHYLNMNNPEMERFNEKREDIIIPDMSRTYLLEFNIMS